MVTVGAGGGLSVPACHENFVGESCCGVSGLQHGRPGPRAFAAIGMCQGMRGFDGHRYLLHCLTTAGLTRHLSLKFPGADQNDFFIAGLLHDFRESGDRAGDASRIQKST